MAFETGVDGLRVEQDCDQERGRKEQRVPLGKGLRQMQPCFEKEQCGQVDEIEGVGEAGGVLG